MTEHILIIGGGLAGAKAAEGARDAGHDGPITIVAAEDKLPYERPPLSKDLLAGKSDFGSAVVNDNEWFGDNSVDLRLGTRVVSLDRDSRVATVGDGDEIPWSKLILATGSSPVRLDVPGSDLDGVHTLRSIDDARELRSRFSEGIDLLIVGSGWIGCEVAATARQAGCNVTVATRDSLPLSGVLGDEFARYLFDLHRDHGVEFATGTTVESYGGDEAVESVRLSDGSEHPASLVIEAIGVTPNVELAEIAGLEVDNGILVDETLRTSDPDIWAVGDIANHLHPFYGRRIRSEHWSAALNQGLHAGRGAAGSVEKYDRLPMFFTDQYEMGMEYRGHAPDADDVILRGTTKEGEFLVFYLDNGVVSAVANVNVWDVGDDVEQLLRAGVSPDRRKIADWGTPLSQLPDTAQRGRV